jgi:hypothetical protein
MGRWRGRRLLAAPRAACFPLFCALAVFAVAGCGAEERDTDPRPQPPTRVSVAVSEGAVDVQPPRIAFGPEPAQQIPQNQHAGQPQVHSDGPLDVVLVAANLTQVESHLVLHGQGKSIVSQPLVASGNITMQASLPAGVYTIRAADIPGAKPGRLSVGRFRSTSDNDVLLP